MIKKILQGFTQTQQDDEDFAIKQGKTSRRKGEEKQRVATTLSGRDARELYLQCYQLILWKQCFWLVNVKGFPKELETVVRDLWGLRLGVVHDRKATAGIAGDQFSSVGFSSTSEAEMTDSDGKSLISTRSRRSDIEKEKLPKLVETLALCYLGTLLMRLPTSMGEIYAWAAREEIVFTRAVSDGNFISFMLCISIGEINANYSLDQRGAKRNASPIARSFPLGLGNQRAFESVNAASYRV